MLVDTHEPSTTPWSATMNRKTQPYYIVREASQDFDDYWGDKVDPDGKERNLLGPGEGAAWVQDNLELNCDVRIKVAGGRVLDIGCGPGWLGVTEPGNWYGTELNTLASEEATRNGYTMTSPCLEDHKADFYDCVVMYHVIEHMPDPITEIQQVYRILKRGGWLILGTPDFDSPCAERFGDKYRLLHDPTHCSLFTDESMFRFLRDHNFEVIKRLRPFPHRYATAENMQRWNAGPAAGISPPWPGNFMTFYSRK